MVENCLNDEEEMFEEIRESGPGERRRGRGGRGRRKVNITRDESALLLLLWFMLISVTSTKENALRN